MRLNRFLSHLTDAVAPLNSVSDRFAWRDAWLKSTGELAFVKRPPPRRQSAQAAWALLRQTPALHAAERPRMDNVGCGRQFGRADALRATAASVTADDQASETVRRARERVAGRHSTANAEI